MTTFLFWNINRKSLEEAIVNLAFRHEVDVLILAECDIPPKVMLKALNPKKKDEFHFPFSACEKIMIFTRFLGEFLEPVSESGRVTIRRLMLPAREEILLAAVHFPSKLYWSEESQKLECTELSRMIRDEEDRVGHQRTVLVGDFNMNPFEPGLVAAAGLHSVMARDIALRRDRVVQSRAYPFFYNPMWGFFGDATRGPCGTYYYERAEHTIFFWNMFDQVLIRPDLLHAFRNEKLEILTEDGINSFLSASGLPDSSSASDHLPLLFRLNL